MRPFLPFATLLSAAFLLGCQDLGSGPVVPEDLGIQAAKGHKGKAEKTNTTAEVALESIGTEVDHRNIELASSPVPWTSAKSVNVAGDNKKALFLESGGSRATQGPTQ